MLLFKKNMFGASLLCRKIVRTFLKKTVQVVRFGKEQERAHVFAYKRKKNVCLEDRRVNDTELLGIGKP